MGNDIKGVLIFICPKCNDIVKERWDNLGHYECDNCNVNFDIASGIPDNLILDENNL